MTKDELGHFEAEIIKMYLPKTDRKIRKQIRKYCNENNIPIFSENLKKRLEGIEKAIVRHRYTDYDAMVRMVGRDRARFYIGQELPQKEVQ